MKRKKAVIIIIGSILLNLAPILITNYFKFKIYTLKTDNEEINDFQVEKKPEETKYTPVENKNLEVNEQVQAESKNNNADSSKESKQENTNKSKNETSNDLNQNTQQDDIKTSDKVQSKKENKPQENPKEDNIQKNESKADSQATKETSEEKNKINEDNKEPKIVKFYESITQGKKEFSSENEALSRGLEITNKELDYVLSYNEQHLDSQIQPNIRYYRVYPSVVDENGKTWYYLHFFCEDGNNNDEKLKKMF